MEPSQGPTPDHPSPYDPPGSPAGQGSPGPRAPQVPVGSSPTASPSGPPPSGFPVPGPPPPTGPPVPGRPPEPYPGLDPAGWSTAQPPVAPGAPPGTSPVIGWLLLLPAVLLTVWQLLVPAVRSLALSVRDVGLTTGDPGEFVGLQNYLDVLAGLGIGPWFGAIALGLLPAVLGLVVGIVLGWGHARSGRTAARVAWSLLGAAVALVAPLSATAAWAGPASFVARQGWVSPIGYTPALIASVVTWFAVPALIAALVSSAAARASARAGGVLGVLGSVTVLGGIAWGLQSFTIPVFTGATAPATFTLQSSFQIGRMGVGAATDVMIGAVVGLCGVAAVLLLVSSRVGLELAAPVPRAGSGAVPPAAVGRGPVGTVLAVAFLVVLLVLALPWLAGALTPPPDAGGSAVNTWLPPLVGALVGILVAALAGAGIGYARPLGRGSEWLLLLFSPWLFAGFAVTATASFRGAQDAEVLGTFAALVPPFVIVPFVIVATYVGAAIRRAGPGAVRTALLPTGALALAGVAAFVWFQVQSLYRAYILWSGPLDAPYALVVAHAASRFMSDGSAAGVLTPLPVLVLFAAVFGVAFAGLDRWRVVRTV